MKENYFLVLLQKNNMFSYFSEIVGSVSCESTITHGTFCMANIKNDSTAE